MGAFTGVSVFLSGITEILGHLWSLLLLVLSALWSLFVGLVPVSILVALSTVWGLVLVGALVVVATAINFAGRDDVYESLSRRLSNESASSTDDIDLSAIDATQVTDDAGRFSPRALEAVTGLSPPEFIMLFVQANGGRVRQMTITRALPWSKSTVSRYLDLLESEGALVRIKGGRGNVVCLPDQVPDGYAAE
jgi:hypothetical protein